MTPIDTIINARLQYIYNLKLYNFIVKDNVDPGTFDGEVELESDGNVLLLKKNLFRSEGILDAAANNVLMSLGVLFITIDTALCELGLNYDPKDLTELGMFRSLIYMLRSAFAHNMLMPRWNVRGPYADLSFNIDLGKSKISGNFSSLDGQIFSEKHLGGFRHILRLIDAGTILISKIKKA